MGEHAHFLPPEYTEILTSLLETAGDFHDTARMRHLNGVSVQREIVRKHLASYGFDTTRELAEVVADCAQKLEQWSLDTTHPRHFGWFNPTPHPVALFADVLADLYNPQLARWDTSPYGTELERHVIEWLASRLGYPAGQAAGAFTTGGAEANLTALTLALTAGVDGYREFGLRGASRRPVVYVTGETHRTIEKAARICGLGRAALRVVRTDPTGRMDAADLADKASADRAAGGLPLLTVASAGTTNMGAIDPVDEAADICSEFGMWLHVDAAWGGGAAFGDRVTVPVGRGDSLTFDPHKLLAMPLGTGLFLTRHPDALHEAFRIEADYAVADGVHHDFYINSAQWSRRLIGLRLFLLLAVEGAEGLTRMVDHQIDMADALRNRLADDGWTIVNDTALPVVVFRDDRLAGAHGTVAERVNHQAKAWVAATGTPGGDDALRACITSYRTDLADLDVLIDELRSARDQ